MSKNSRIQNRNIEINTFHLVLGGLAGAMYGGGGGQEENEKREMEHSLTFSMLGVRQKHAVKNNLHFLFRVSLTIYRTLAIFCLKVQIHKMVTIRVFDRTE